MNPKSYILSTVIIVFTAITSHVSGQEDFYSVYQYETPYKGHLILGLWNTYIAKSRSTQEYAGKDISRENLWAHSVEAEYGLTDHISIDAYSDFQDTRSGNLKFIRAHFAGMFRFAQRYDWFVNTAFYMEYYLPAKSYSNSQELEARIILDKDLGDFRIALNPTLKKYLGGKEDQSLRPGFSGGLYYRRFLAIQPGIEFYTDFEEKSSFIFPTFNIHFNPHLAWNLGVGFNTVQKDNHDKIILKSILTLDMMAFRPSRFMR